MKKLTFLGDIMTEPSTTAQARRAGGVFDYTPLLGGIKALLAESDYVVGNLETPLAGAERGYSDTLFSFNAPDSFARALKETGIDALSLANNHVLDRGGDGLTRTLQTLRELDIPCTGAYDEEAPGDRNLYFTLGDTRIAVIAYTYGSNIKPKTPEEEARINYLRPGTLGILREPFPAVYTETKRFIESLLGRTMIADEFVELRHLLNIEIAYPDNVFAAEDSLPQLRRLAEDYARARAKADLVLFYPHIGGQFNTKAGSFSRFIMAEGIRLGFDAILAGHSHTTQEAGYREGIPCFYCLGNLTMSPCTNYTVPENLPEYGLAVHLYLEEQKICRCSFSVLKMVESETQALRVLPVDELAETLSGEDKEKLLADLRQVYARILGKDRLFPGILREYEL